MADAQVCATAVFPVVICLQNFLPNRSKRHTKNNISSRMPKFAVRLGIGLNIRQKLMIDVGGKIASKQKRWTRDVGMGIKTPLEAMNGTYIGVFAPSSFS